MDSLISLNYNSVENPPGYDTRVAFTVNSSTLFKEDVETMPTTFSSTTKGEPIRNRKIL